MRPQEIIARKRDGRELSAEQIGAFIDGVCDGSWADYQITALVMAIFINGLNAEEQDALVRAMLHSGEVLDLSDIDAPKADKHSTGGVGDKTSLIIAPLAAACGVAVPMISGRGLGHTGGTLDKLESIPGYNVNLSTDKFRSIIRSCGFAMTGQTADIAPADKKLYALRDATATVPYIPLIVGSIMSKKLAEGLDALVLDVKTGSGAFMQSIEDARTLAKALVSTGKGFGVKTEAVISDMSQPLGQYVGNAHEIFECVKIMRGEADVAMKPTEELSVDLTARMLVLSGLEQDLGSARSRVNSKLSGGEALERFRKNIGLQSGDPSICDRPESILDGNVFECVVNADRPGYIVGIDTFGIGNALAEAGGGRTRADDVVDHLVGLKCLSTIGREVRSGDALCVAYLRDPGFESKVRRKLGEAFTIAEAPPEIVPNLIAEIIS